MASCSTPQTDAWLNLPAQLREGGESALRAGENVLAWFEPDLDDQLRFARQLVILTDQRVLSVGQDEASPETVADEPSPLRCRSWPLHAAVKLRAGEHGITGTLELLGPDCRLAYWRYTPGRTAAAHRLVGRFEALGSGTPVEEENPETAAEPACPSCGMPVGKDEGLCATCSGETAERPAKSLFRLLGFGRPYLGMTILGFSLALAATVSNLVPLYLTKPIFDQVLVPYQNPETRDSANFGLLPWFLLGMAGASLLTFLLSWSRTYVLAWVSERIGANLRNETYGHLQRLSLEFFGGRRTGELISRISTDTERISYFLSVHLLDFANDLIMICVISVGLLAIDPKLALASLCPAPVIAYLVYRVRGRLRGGFQLDSRAWAGMTSVLADTIPGIRVVKAFAQEKREIERFRQANDHVLTVRDRVNWLWAFFGPLVVLLTDTGTLIIWIFGVWRVYQGDLTVGALAVFLGAIGRFYSRLDSMSRMVSATQRAAAAAQRVLGILDRKTTVPEPARPVPTGRLRGQIELRDVGFRYGNRTVIQGVNLSIRPGEMIGLVGPSGSGKTTLVNLVCRFYDVAEGAILVDGTDIRSFPMEDYRRHIGLVLQEPFLFFGTIAENIAYGRPEASRREIVAAARAAQAHEFILRLPDGYDSLVGERGQFLSGGERQRISIARALLIDPRILILDEATSSVDTHTEQEIQLALENLIRGRTTIAIAHRLSTLRRADRLVVMERGRITEMGPHEELLSTAGTYARLYRAQSEMLEGQPA